jgi:hypothetical protein
MGFLASDKWRLTEKCRKLRKEEDPSEILFITGVLVSNVPLYIAKCPHCVRSFIL